MKKITIQVYKNNEFIGRIYESTEDIAHLIGGASPDENYKLVDEFDNLILTSIGFFLDYVPNQLWLKKELLPLLQSIQFGQTEIKKVEFIRNE